MTAEKFDSTDDRRTRHLWFGKPARRWVVVLWIALWLGVVPLTLAWMASNYLQSL